MPIILFIAANQSSSSSAIQVSSSGAQYKFYSCKIYNNGSLVRDFVPAKRISDDKCGLWDKVKLKFYTDESGGNFTAGPNVNPWKQIKGIWAKTAADTWSQAL